MTVGSEENISVKSSRKCFRSYKLVFCFFLSQHNSSISKSSLQVHKSCSTNHKRNLDAQIFIEISKILTNYAHSFVYDSVYHLHCLAILMW